jgi:thiol-disulfide isomerase/thioredoxin
MIRLLTKLTFGLSRGTAGLFFGFISHIFAFTGILIALSVIAYVVTYVNGSFVGFIRNKDEISFDLTSSTSSAVMSESLKKRKYILFFVKPNCKKCIAQLPFLQELHEEYGVDVYAVTRILVKTSAVTLPDGFTETERYTSDLNGLVEDPTRNLSSQVRVFSFILPHLVVVDEGNKIVLDITGKITDRDAGKVRKALEPSKDIEPNVPVY